MNTSKHTRRLIFETSDPTVFGQHIEAEVEAGARKVLIQPMNQLGQTIVQDCRERGLGHVLQCDDHSDSLSVGNSGASQVVVVPVEDGPGLAAALHNFIDLREGVLLAPETNFHWSRRPLFLISIPKAGTHMLYQLASVLGYRAGVIPEPKVLPSHWYCIEYDNSHTVARDFFVDTVRRSRHGNRHHPFPHTPCLFIYRNPLDVVVSEANYYHKEGKTAYYGYFHGESFEQRLLKLIGPDELLGTIRQRINNFTPWLQFPNVVPISFEELVGPKGGGDPTLQEDLIWSLMLKLQAPGDASLIASQVFNTQSPTFHKAQLGVYHQAFSTRAWRKFLDLDQDFMLALGYEANSDVKDFRPPIRADEFRHRPLLIPDPPAEDPILLERSFFGFNFVLWNGRYYALPEGIVNLDLCKVPVESLSLLPQGNSLQEVKSCLLAGVNSPQLLANRFELLRIEFRRSLNQSLAPPLFLGEHRNFKLILIKGRVLGLPFSLGEVDLTNIDLDLLGAMPGVINGKDIDTVRANIDANLAVQKL